MRFIVVALIMVFWTNTSQAQIFEVGPYIGGSNFIGDVGATDYVNPNSLAFGAIVKWNRSMRHAWRVSIIHTSLQANDTKADAVRRQQRGYSFSNSLTELTLGIEFNFWEWNIYAYKPEIVPYIATGISGIRTHDLYAGSDDKLHEEGVKYDLTLPMILGVKGNIGNRWVVALEIGARLSFTDNIDGSTPSEFDESKKPLEFGNQNTNDWYMFTGMTLTYTFGCKPCYDVY